MSRVRVAALALFLAVAAPASAVEIETATGVVDVAQTPKRVAVFDIAAVDTLDRLGVEVAGVPDTLYLPQLKSVAERGAVVGSLFEPNLEALSALAPDLVIIGERTSAQRAAVEKVAPVIDMTLTGADMIPQARARTLAYGELFDRNEQAAALVGEMDEALRKARAAVAGKGNALILMTSGAKITAYGSASRFGWLYRELSIEPAADTAVTAKHGEAVSFEFVREANPDWLIVLDRAAAIGSGEANARATLDNELVAATTAWKKGQVVYLPSADFYIAAGGASATVRVLDAITKAYAPD